MASVRPLSGAYGDEGQGGAVIDFAARAKYADKIADAIADARSGNGEKDLMMTNEIRALRCEILMWRVLCACAVGVVLLVFHAG